MKHSNFEYTLDMLNMCKKKFNPEKLFPDKETYMAKSACPTVFVEFI